MSAPRLAALVVLTMLAFAANSIFCRLALKTTAIDAASFTTIRLVSGALVLVLIVRARRIEGGPRGSWPAAAALFTYAAAFSWAYVSLPAAVGALLLFGAVQVTMIGVGLKAGERFAVPQWAGFLLAVGGLVSLLMPGLSAPDPLAAALMLVAGVAWGVYSLLGRRLGNATAATAGNFVLALPFTLALSVLTLTAARIDGAGVAYAIASGALASGLGYAVWYSVLPSLPATLAATLQLSVPVIAATGGVVFLDEAITLRLVLCSLAILGGIALVIAGRRRKA
jgi:drug/metabolite transporter (DMT)-like permease